MANFTVKVGDRDVSVALSQDETFYYAWKGLLPHNMRDRIRAAAAQSTYRDRWPKDVNVPEPKLRPTTPHRGGFF